MSDDWIEEADEYRSKKVNNSNKDVTIIETNLAAAIKITSAIFKTNIDQIPIQFTKKGVRIIATNRFTPPEPFHTLIHLILPRDSLDRYHCGIDDLIVGVDCLTFHTSLKPVKAGSKIRIAVKAYDDTPTKMSLEVTTGTSVVTKQISLVPIGKPTVFPKTTYTNHCKITSIEFRTVCAELFNKNARLTIKAIGGYLKFTIQTDGLDYKSKHVFGERYPEDDEKDVFVCRNMMIRQLSGLAKLAAYNRPITIYTNPEKGEFKMKIVTEVGTNKGSIGKVAVYIRPAGSM